MTTNTKAIIVLVIIVLLIPQYVKLFRDSSIEANRLSLIDVVREQQLDIIALQTVQKEIKVELYWLAESHNGLWRELAQTEYSEMIFYQYHNRVCTGTCHR